VASSRHALAAVVVGKPVPIGIPAFFLADQFSRGRSAEQILDGTRGLIAEYAGAEGYSSRWGHLIELRLGNLVLWRVVPVAMWDDLAERRAGSRLPIEELVTLVQPDIRPLLASQLPRGLLLTGCQGASRLSLHALFALLLVEPRAATAVRHWLAAPFLTDLLPSLLRSIEGRVADFLRNASP
jgi:hypothetical protein